jgi:hypothetical protein
MLLKDRYTGWKDEEEDVSSYWIILRKRKNTGHQKKMH